MTVSRQPSAQIEALTRGVRLPLPAIQPEHLRVIMETLAVAVEEVANEHNTLARHGGEPEISAIVEARLCAYLIEPDVGNAPSEPALLGMWRQLACAVARGKESVGHDGIRIELRPDLNVFLFGRHPSFPLIVECKIIDVHGGKTIGMYFNKGVTRFLNGDYGWAAREGVMLAYVRDGSRIQSTLVPAMATNGSATYAMLGAPEPVSKTSADLARSTHARDFRYHDRMPPDDDPGWISLWHLWLPVLRDVA